MTEQPFEPDREEPGASGNARGDSAGRLPAEYDDPRAAREERRLLVLLAAMVGLIVLGGAGITLVYLFMTGGR